MSKINIYDNKNQKHGYWVLNWMNILGYYKDEGCYNHGKPVGYWKFEDLSKNCLYKKIFYL